MAKRKVNIQAVEATGDEIQEDSKKRKIKRTHIEMVPEFYKKFEKYWRRNNFLSMSECVRSLIREAMKAEGDIQDE